MYNQELSNICANYTKITHEKLEAKTPEELFFKITIDNVEIALFDNIIYGYILVFSGFNSLQDISNLIDFRYRRRSEGGVFSSLRSVYSNINKQLITILEKNNINEVIVTGYSMGAILATFFTYYSDIKVTNCYLFGSPRAGDENFSNSYNDKFLDITYRVTVAGDFVSHLPVNGWHIGNPIILDGKERQWKEIVQNTFFDDPKFLFLTPLIIFTFGILIKLKLIENKHDLKNYVNLTN